MSDPPRSGPPRMSERSNIEPIQPQRDETTESPDNLTNYLQPPDHYNDLKVLVLRG